MNLVLENELVEGMREHVDGMELTRDVVAAAASRHRRDQQVRRTGSVVGTFVLASALVSALGIGPLGSMAGHGVGGARVSPMPTQGDASARPAAGVAGVLQRAAMVAANGTQPRDDEYPYLHSVSYVVGGTTRDGSQERQEVRVWLSMGGTATSCKSVRTAATGAGRTGVWREAPVPPRASPWRQSPARSRL